MRTVTQRIKDEIEYLVALAAMYERSDAWDARQATLDAIGALRNLLGTLNGELRNSAEAVSIAA